MQKEREERGL